MCARDASKAGDFGHVAANEQHDEGGQDAEQEHRPPAENMVAERAAIEEAVGDRGENEAARIAALQDAGHRSARPRRDRLHRQRAAEPPFAAHRDTEQRSQNQEDPKVRRKGRERADDRIAEDVEHQRGLAPPYVADAAKDERADETHREGQEQCIGDRRHIDAELLGDVLEDEGQNEEIERVEHPAEIRGDDGLYLLRRQVVHNRPPLASALVPRRRIFVMLAQTGVHRQGDEDNEIGLRARDYRARRGVSLEPLGRISGG